jgi:hypothetical protein
MFNWVRRRMSDKGRRTGASTPLFTALSLWIGRAASAAAQASGEAATVTAYTMTPERLAASLAAVVAMFGATVGGIALPRSGRRVGAGNGRRRAILAMIMGPIGAVIGGLVVVTADGGLGTGNRQCRLRTRALVSERACSIRVMAFRRSRLVRATQVREAGSNNSIGLPSGSSS